MPVTPDITKLCPKCKIDLPINKFGPDKRSPSGLKSWCKDCHNKASRIAYKTNSKQIIAKNTAWAKANPEKRNQHSKNWRAKNSGKIAATKKAYNLKNQEKIAMQKTGWRAANKERERLYSATRRARKRQNGIFVVTNKDVSRLLIMPCLYCGSPSESIDHIIPLALGGTHSIGNLAPSCKPCNLSKGSKFLAQWKLSKLQ